VATGKSSFSTFYGVALGLVILVLWLFVKSHVQIDVFLACVVGALATWAFITTYGQSFSPRRLQTVVLAIVGYHVALLIAVIQFTLHFSRLQWMLLVGAEVFALILVTAAFSDVDR
jgi:hypothetical protein